MENKSTKYYSSIQENAVADYLGWKVVAASGARHLPGDVVDQNWLGECKTRTKPSDYIEFNLSTYIKIKEEAMSQMKSPIYIADNGTQKIKNTMVLFPHNLIFNGNFENESIVLDCEPKVKTLKCLGANKYPYIYKNWGGSEDVVMMPLELFKMYLEGEYNG